MPELPWKVRQRSTSVRSLLRGAYRVSQAVVFLSPCSNEKQLIPDPMPGALGEQQRLSLLPSKRMVSPLSARAWAPEAGVSR